MSSRSATVLVIFVVAIIAFCFASVFAAMTGPISILPNGTDSGGILDDLSAITNDSGDGNSYGYQDYNDYSSSDSSSSYDDSDVETTVDDSDSSDDESSGDVVETITSPPVEEPEIETISG
ncbi:hypothetical protein [Methanobrevibacter sp.]|uniref:hypothetical protein n=1 Tax=Methanobrevibacter sp. TaxID=66852 RepID=UPI00388E7894